MPLQVSRLLKAIVSLILIFSLGACSQLPKLTAAQKAPYQQQCVVLVHGLWRSGSAMRGIAQDLEHFGYQTVTVDYPSTSASIPELSQTYIAPAVAQCEAAQATHIHMVTHSMGGILVRQYLQTHRLPEGSRVVMMSPPNQGSKLSQYFADHGWYRALVGPAGSSLTKREDGIIPLLQPIPEPVGIVAAYRSWSLWPSAWLPSPNDGTVSLENMVLAEMDDFVLVEAGHAMMRYDDETRQRIREFLAAGKFTPNQDSVLQALRDQAIRNASRLNGSNKTLSLYGDSAAAPSNRPAQSLF